MHKLAFVIPTMDRPKDMRALLRSIRAQTRRPDQLIVVDASNPDIRTVIDEFPELPLDYVRVYPPSLAAQRNAGMERLARDITLAGYLDDDTVLEPDAIRNLIEYWEGAGLDLGGTTFSITNTPPAQWTRVKSLLWMDSPTPGRVLPSGCTSILGFQQKTIETDWLCGGATVWRREVIERFPYDEWYVGTGYLEDVDYSFAVRAHYRLAVVGEARLAHYSRPIRRDRHYLWGKWQIVNRMHFVRKYRTRGLSPWRAWVASVGLVAMHAAQALLKLDGTSWDRARGNVAGMLSELTGRRERIGGFLK